MVCPPTNAELVPAAVAGHGRGSAKGIDRAQEPRGRRLPDAPTPMDAAIPMSTGATKSQIVAWWISARNIPAIMKSINTLNARPIPRPTGSKPCQSVLSSSRTQAGLAHGGPINTISRTRAPAMTNRYARTAVRPNQDLGRSTAMPPDAKPRPAGSVTKPGCGARRARALLDSPEPSQIAISPSTTAPMPAPGCLRRRSKSIPEPSVRPSAPHYYAWPVAPSPLSHW
jgi:hypothetical protein